MRYFRNKTLQKFARFQQGTKERNRNLARNLCDNFQ